MDRFLFFLKESVYIYIYIYSFEAAKYNDYISADGKTSPTSVPDMTLSNLMVSLK